MQSFTWTQTSIHLRTLWYSMSVFDVGLPDWQRQVLGDGHRPRRDRWKISPSGNTMNLQKCANPTFIAIKSVDSPPDGPFYQWQGQMGAVCTRTGYVLVHRSQDSLSRGSERRHDCFGGALDVVDVHVIVAFSKSKIR